MVLSVNLNHQTDPKKGVTYICIKVEELLGVTVLEGLFGEYHSSSAALGRQRPGVTKQPPFSDWPASPVCH